MWICEINIFSLAECNRFIAWSSMGVDVDGPAHRPFLGDFDNIFLVLGICTVSEYRPDVLAHLFFDVVSFV